jgi:hypothetical protein
MGDVMKMWVLRIMARIIPGLVDGEIVNAVSMVKGVDKEKINQVRKEFVDDNADNHEETESGSVSSRRQATGSGTDQTWFS